MKTIKIKHAKVGQRLTTAAGPSMVCSVQSLTGGWTRVTYNTDGTLWACAYRNSCEMEVVG